MPLGATPSRWCVCQFHHFRAQKLALFATTWWVLRLVLRCGVSIFVTHLYTVPLERSFSLRRQPDGQIGCGQRPPEGGAERIVVLMLSCSAVYCNVSGSVCSPARNRESELRVNLPALRHTLQLPNPGGRDIVKKLANDRMSKPGTCERRLMQKHIFRKRPLQGLVSLDSIRLLFLSLSSTHRVGS